VDRDCEEMEIGVFLYKLLMTGLFGVREFNLAAFDGMALADLYGLANKCVG